MIPESTMPSKVPAPPMLAMPVPIRRASAKCSRSAPTSGPATPATKATGDASLGASIRAAAADTIQSRAAVAECAGKDGRDPIHGELVCCELLRLRQTGDRNVDEAS